MAYISHSPIRDLRIPGVSASILVRSALVAALAAGAVLALSSGAASPPAALAPLAKADRLAAPVAAASVGAGVSVDVANRTTTIERGAAMPLSADSPFNPAAK